MSAPLHRTNGSGRVPEALRWPRPDVGVDLTETQDGTALPDDLEWHVSYDRASIERFLAEVEAERGRLQNEIEMTQARLEQARAAKVVRAATAQTEVAALVLAAQEKLAAIERQHHEVLETIRAAAVEEAARLLAAARTEADEVRNVATSLSARVNTQPLASAAAASEGSFRASSAEARSDAR